MNFDTFELSYLLGLLHKRQEQVPSDTKAQELIDKIHLDYPELEKITGTTTTHPREPQVSGIFYNENCQCEYCKAVRSKTNETP